MFRHTISVWRFFSCLKSMDQIDVSHQNLKGWICVRDANLCWAEYCVPLAACHCVRDPSRDEICSADVTFIGRSGSVCIQKLSDSFSMDIGRFQSPLVHPITSSTHFQAHPMIMLNCSRNRGAFLLDRESLNATSGEPRGECVLWYHYSFGIPPCLR
jgi:hypothetical protein